MFRELKAIQTEISQDVPKKKVQIRRGKFVTCAICCGQQWSDSSKSPKRYQETEIRSDGCHWNARFDKSLASSRKHHPWCCVPKLYWIAVPLKFKVWKLSLIFKLNFCSLIKLLRHYLKVFTDEQNTPVSAAINVFWTSSFTASKAETIS